MPVPPVPVPSAVIRVPLRTLVPVMIWPTARAPLVTAVTVSVVLLIEPVTTASAVARSHADLQRSKLVSLVNVL